MLLTIILISAAIIISITVISVIILKRPPSVAKCKFENYEARQSEEKTLKIGQSFIRKNQWDFWELFVKGNSYERGLVAGKLTAPQIYMQEKIFVKEIRKIIQNRLYLFFLKLIVAWMNRKLNRFIGPEYCEEIYGISRSASREFKMIGPSYIRLLNYHAAHDIGHTLQYMNFVGCTSFSVWGSNTSDGKLIHARNFDFHIGDEFSRDKIMAFYAPDKGFKFAMVTWGGMIGTISGMNEKGIVVTVNAAKSKLPLTSSTPITILVRNILQYSDNLHKAKQIVTDGKIFVSESFHISCGEQNNSVLVEKTPYKTAFYEPSEQLVCTNHFQSSELKGEFSNIKQINESSSVRRFHRVEELLKEHKILNIEKTVEILRDNKGLNNAEIGNGNELAINQLIAHHSIIFKPAELKMWISAGPYGLGEFVCYNLHDIFSTVEKTDIDLKSELADTNNTIPADTFLTNGGYENYLKFKELRNQIKSFGKFQQWHETYIDEFISLNPESYLSYWESGDYFKNNKKFTTAAQLYEKALQKQIPTLNEQKQIEKNLAFCLKKS